MHQETLGYIWHQVPYSSKRKPAGYRTETPTSSEADVSAFHAHISAGIATLGTDLRESAFAWDNEAPVQKVHVNAFGIDAYKVTNGHFMEFVRAGGYQAPQWWRPEDWAWIESASVAHPAFWEREGDRWFWDEYHRPGNDTWTDDARIDALVDRLRAASLRFASLWDAKDVSPFVTTRRVFDHPTAGRLELDHHRLAVLDQPGLQLVVYTAAPGSDSIDRLRG